jgi:hypothetical protein
MSTRRMALLSILYAVLAAGAWCAYVFWGWIWFFRSANRDLAGLWLPRRTWHPEELQASITEASRWAHASEYAAIGLSGLALGSAAVGAWRTRHEWRTWPWPSLITFIPALFAASITLMGAAKGDGLEIVLGISIVSSAAAAFDLRRGQAGARSRPVPWAVLAFSVLAAGLLLIVRSG